MARYWLSDNTGSRFMEFDNKTSILVCKKATMVYGHKCKREALADMHSAAKDWRRVNELEFEMAGGITGGDII